MPVKLVSIDIQPELSSGTKPYLQGPFLGKMVATIEFKAEWKAEPDVVYYINFVSASKKIIWVGKSFETEGFKLGDTIEVTGSSANDGTYTITAISGGTITVAESLTNESIDSGLIEGKTECTGVRFRYNTIENSAAIDFNSLTDGNELILSAEDLDYSDTSTEVPMDWIGTFHSNNLGSATIKGSGTLNQFIITHTFFINPFFLLAQLADLENSIPPDYFLNTKCLKYIYSPDLLYSGLDPNNGQFSGPDYMWETFQLGNTGWGNERLNGGTAKYTMASIDFEVGGEAKDYADFNQETDFEIVINSTNGTFSNNNTKFVINHFILPESETEYKNTSRDQTQNFMFDRRQQTVGSAAVNGDNYGTSKQVLTDIVGTYNSASQITITGKINLSTAYKARISTLENKKFMLLVTVQDHTKATSSTDVVTCFFDEAPLSQYDTDLSDPGVGTIGTVFNYFPTTDVSVDEAGMFVEDLQRGKSILTVDISEDALINDVSVIIRAEKADESFELERRDFSFAGAVISGGVQQMNIDELRGFILGPSNPFNVVSLKRRSDLDSGDLKRYELIYSFRIRWEYFIQLAGVHPDFHDILQRFNGSNQDWNRYFIGSGWSLNYVVQMNIQKDGYINTITNSKTLSAYTYDDATDWSQSVKVYDIDTDTEIPDNILSDKIVRVEATFDKVSGSNPDAADVFGVIEYEPYESGGENVIRNINSGYIHESGSPFESTLGNKLLETTGGGSDPIVFIAHIDGRKLTNPPKLSARIYDKSVPPLGGYKEFQDDELFEFQDGVGYDFQN